MPIGTPLRTLIGTMTAESTPPGIPYSYYFIVTRMNSEHGNPTLAGIRIGGSATSALPNTAFDIGTVDSLGGNGQGTVISKRVVVGAAHGKSYDVLVSATFNSPPARTHEYYFLRIWNGNSTTDKYEEYYMSGFEGWISNDGGSTGVWWPMTMTFQSGDTRWTVVDGMPRYNWQLVDDAPDTVSAFFEHTAD